VPPLVRTTAISAPLVLISAAIHRQDARPSQHALAMSIGVLHTAPSGLTAAAEDFSAYSPQHPAAAAWVCGAWQVAGFKVPAVQYLQEAR
jgi:hypothetical protein